MLQGGGRVGWRRIVVGVVGALVVLLLVVALGIAWYFAGVAVAVDHSVQRQLTATPVGTDRVRLPATGDALLRGRYGLDWDGGYAQIGDIVERDAGSVVRPLIPVRGTLTAGTRVRVDTYAYTGDPRTALGLQSQDVTVHDALGDFPAWYVPAETGNSTWFVFVHGHDGSRAESLRYLTAVHSLGLPALVPTYRNDVGAPSSPDGVDHLGATEWEDVDAAVHWALDHGAQDVVIGGWSMGGAIALRVADASDLAGKVRGLVLDSPVLDWRDVLYHQAAARGLPSAETALALWVAGWRYGLDFDRSDWVTRARELRVPTLLVHSDSDDYVPDGPAKRLAGARPDLVTLRLVPGVGHTQAWNADPQAYQSMLAGWLGAHVPTTAASR